MTDWFHNDDLFFSQLARGHEFAAHVGQLLTDEGLYVVVPEMNADRRPRRTADSPVDGDYRDEAYFKTSEKDMWVEGLSVEVKSRDLRFTSPRDYKYSTAFVDTVAGWEAKAEKPVAVVLISQVTRRPVVVSVRNWETEWTIRTVFDRKRQISVTNYEVAREKLKTWEQFVTWLKGRNESS